jgi:hypothetical protein
MKRNGSLLVLAFEIAAIIILHTLKISQAETINNSNKESLARLKIAAPEKVIKRQPLLSIK